MKVLLIGVDFKNINLALAKLSTYHKSLGNSVSLIKLNFNGYPSKRFKNINASMFDIVYVSQLFECNTNNYKVVDCNNIIYGGVGLNNNQLPLHIDSLDLDYSLFDVDKSYGYITKGCIRNCWFCKVPKHEGYIRLYSTIDKIKKHKEVILFDNNILGFYGHMQILEDLVNIRIRLQFNQGLDIRLLNDENALLISKLNHIGELIFAFDDVKDEKLINSKLNLLKKYVKKDWKIKFYIYHNDKAYTLFDTLHRVDWCRKNKVLPYLMRDQNCFKGLNKDFLTDMAAYCNQPSFFKTNTFEEFLCKRHKNIDRITKSLKQYNDHLESEGKQ